MNDPGCANKPDTGPIPPGVYEMNTNQLTEAGFVRASARAVGGFVFGSNYGGDWGSFRVPLHPTSDTNAFGRDGFYLHGGAIDGSEGVHRCRWRCGRQQYDHTSSSLDEIRHRW